MICFLYCTILLLIFFVFFNDTATTAIYTYLHTLSLHYALPIWRRRSSSRSLPRSRRRARLRPISRLPISVSGRDGPMRVRTLHPRSLRCWPRRSEEHTSELQSLMRISYAVFCLKKKNTTKYQEPQQTLRYNPTKQELNIA